MKKFTLFALWAMAFFVSLTGVALSAVDVMVPALAQSVPTVLSTAAAGLPSWVGVVAGIGYMALEAYLGSTTDVKSGSVLALLFNVGKSLLGGLAGKGDGGSKAP